ncbi:MAG: hypothetical protein Phog2KO_45120 [Phototrophicaceae bacterium]
MSHLQQAVPNWVGTLGTNQWLIEKQVEGLSHEQSMIAPPFRANRLNWVIGHIVEHRDWMLRALDENTLMTAKDVMLYRRGSEALQDDSPVMDLVSLMALMKRAKDCLISAISQANEDFLIEKPQTGILLESHKDKTRFERLQGLLWHETYHMGQLELLRQLAGTNDAILK